MHDGAPLWWQLAVARVEELDEGLTEGSCRRARRDHPNRHRGPTVKEKRGDDTPVAFQGRRSVSAVRCPFDLVVPSLALAENKGILMWWSYEGSPAELARVLDSTEFEAQKFWHGYRNCAGGGRIRLPSIVLIRPKGVYSPWTAHKAGKCVSMRMT
uniref:Uncharacterized protein n=1 Tax=Oryza meridionalis TaxID=40149 RepID=A0A0E0C3C4_9ORYZ